MTRNDSYPGTEYAAAARDALTRSIEALQRERWQAEEGEGATQAELRRLDRVILQALRQREGIDGLLTLMAPELFGPECDACGRRAARLYRTQDGDRRICSACRVSERWARRAAAVRADLGLGPDWRTPLRRPQAV